jgi:integrase
VGLPHLRLHDLRHTHATLMLKAGVHPKVVSEGLGHASIGDHHGYLQPCPTRPATGCRRALRCPARGKDAGDKTRGQC